MLLSLANIHVGWAKSKQEETSMNTDIQKIENVRADHDSAIMAIPGVVSIATGLNHNGEPCIKIGTSVPIETVRPLLPLELSGINVELEYLGEIHSQ